MQGDQDCQGLREHEPGVNPKGTVRDAGLPLFGFPWGKAGDGWMEHSVVGWEGT